MNMHGRVFTLAVAIAITLVTSVQLHATDFAPPRSYPVGTNPVAIVTGDFNGDGKLDLAVANAGSGDICILLGNGDGTFRAAVSTFVSQAGSGPSMLAVGDFNGDKKLDLIVLNAGDASLGTPGALNLLLGNGDGTFQPPVPIQAGQIPTALAVADLNGDTKPDLVVSVGDTGVGPLLVLLGKGDGTFQTPQTIPLDDGAADSIVTADFNGDKKLDLVVAGSRVWMFLGNGDGTFQVGTVIDNSGLSPYLAVGDFNGDHKLDLLNRTVFHQNFIPFVSPGGNFDVTRLMAGQGDGTVSLSDVLDDTQGEGGNLVVGDFNGDGKLDFFLRGPGNDGNNSENLILGKGDGTFVRLPAIAGDIGAFVAAGDFNGDQLLDVAIADSTNNAVVILLNAGPASGADVGVGVNLSQTNSPAGGNLKYTATVYSEGPEDATEVVLTETLPASWKLDLAQASQGTCAGTTTINCDLGAVASGATATVQFQVTPTQAGTFSDSLAVTAAQPDLNVKNNSASFSASIVLPADVGVSCVPSETTGSIGDLVTFAVTVSNAGPAEATNVSLQDILSDPLPVSSLTAGQGSCTYAANTINCGLGALSSGASVSITFAVSMQSAEVFTSSLSVKADQFDINSANNKATVSVTVNQPDFSLAASSSSLSGTNGAQLTDQINVTDLNGFSGSISLTCSINGAAPMPACSLDPGTIPAGTKTPNSTLTISIPGRTAAVSSPFAGGRSRPLYFAGLLLPGMALFGLGFVLRTHRKRLRYAWALCALVFAFMALQTGCGRGNSAPPPPVSQTYVVAVTATSGSVQHSATVTLTVN